MGPTTSPFQHRKPQPSAADSTVFTELPGMPTYNQLSDDERRAVTQYAMSTIGKAPSDARQSQLLLAASLPAARARELGIEAEGADSLALQTDVARNQMLTTSTAQRENERQAKMALPVLETALKQASGTGNDSIGQSDLFQQAGLTGFATLSDSLGERMNEIDRKTESFRSVLRDTFAQFQGTNQQFIDQAKNSIDQYEALREEYKMASDRLFELDKMEREFAMQLELMQRKAALTSGNGDAESRSKAIALIQQYAGDEAGLKRHLQSLGGSATERALAEETLAIIKANYSPAAGDPVKWHMMTNYELLNPGTDAVFQTAMNLASKESLLKNADIVAAQISELPLEQRMPTVNRIVMQLQGTPESREAVRKKLIPIK